MAKSVRQRKQRKGAWCDIAWLRQLQGFLAEAIDSDDAALALPVLRELNTWPGLRHNKFANSVVANNQPDVS